MNRLQILIAVKQRLATGAGQPDKNRTICIAVDGTKWEHRLRGAARQAAHDIQNDVMEYLYPHLTFRQKLGATHTLDQIQAARHAYIDDLIQKEAT